MINGDLRLQNPQKARDDKRIYTVEFWSHEIISPDGLILQVASQLEDAQKSCARRVKNKFFTRQVCVASIANLGALAARKGGSQHGYKYEK